MPGIARAALFGFFSGVLLFYPPEIVDDWWRSTHTGAELPLGFSLLLELSLFAACLTGALIVSLIGLPGAGGGDE